MEDKVLNEKNFIHEEYPQHPWRLWGWLAAVAACSLIFAYSLNRYGSIIDTQYADSPFLQVTNRQLSLFLWQDPSHMRAHVKNKQAYLPAFEYSERVGLDPEYADEYVVGPPELLFLYHTWNRLLGSYYTPQAIPSQEFQSFLLEAPEWQPLWWPAAPTAYQQMIAELGTGLAGDLNLLPETTLPLEVRQAFIGWKNYFYQGSEINVYKPTYSELDKLLAKFPHYNRSYWRNIYGDDYLKSRNINSNQTIPNQELSPLLRIALYNSSTVL